ncbi:MAG TPA: hypothetical protein VLA49_21975, partial [Anaerolineales bacterium]|nr:hypothetical protein [Anaerolineales bacterium]
PARFASCVLGYTHGLTSVELLFGHYNSMLRGAPYGGLSHKSVTDSSVSEQLSQAALWHLSMRAAAFSQPDWVTARNPRIHLEGASSEASAEALSPKGFAVEQPAQEACDLAFTATGIEQPPTCASWKRDEPGSRGFRYMSWIWVVTTYFFAC